MKNVIAVIVLIGILFFSYRYQKAHHSFNPLTYEMQSNEGPVTLDDLRSKHKVILLYFGFLHCPDACPTTLASMSNVIKDLPPERRDQVAFVFVDLDPERDTLPEMKKYTEFFDKKIIPVSIPLEDLDKFTEKFGIVYMKAKIQSKMNYTIDHSTDIIVMNKDGHLMSHIEHGSPKSVFIDRINKTIEGKE
jgi:protein SCO1/2